MLKEKIAEMDKSIKCLALELPGPVWDDVARRWNELKTELTLIKE